MNSTQLNFFIVTEDWPNIKRLFIDHSIKVVRFKTDNTADFMIDDVSFENGRPPIKIGLTRADFIHDIDFKYDESNGEYELDVEKGYVIEFNTGGFYPYSSEVLHRARFYCVTNYYARRGELLTKDEAFKKWVSSIYRSFKNAFLVKLGESKGVMATENTLKWMEENNAEIDGGYLTISTKNRNTIK